ncbi:MAG: sigma-54-dependent transcriptional regulator [Panacagrimonas sp.]
MVSVNNSSEGKQALVVDDEEDIRELLEMTLGAMGVECQTAECVGDARALLARHAFDFCLTDMRLPDGNGIDLVRQIQAQHSHIPVAVITAYGNAQAAVDSLKAGAFDFVSKPVDLAALRKLVETALRLGGADHAVDDGGLLGEHPLMQALRALIDRLARSQAPVHIHGESGTGKELVARLIHNKGPRGQGPFVPVNCGAIPAELMESEFFGHLKGSFTGAIKDKVGLFQAAEGGTLFLDEVADLPLHMQVKLLRAVQERKVRAVGSEKEAAVNVRLISATHKDLAERVAKGEFRQDLFYRINVIELRTPALRERASDIPALAQHILTGLASNTGLAQTPSLSAAAASALQAYPFPGNVRELENVLERAVTLCDGERIDEADLQLRLTSNPGQAATLGLEGDLENRVEEVEKRAIMEALEKARYNKTRAAQLLGLTFRQLRYKVKKLNIE